MDACAWSACSPLRLPYSLRAAIAVSTYIKHHVDIKGIGKSALKSIPHPASSQQKVTFTPQPGINYHINYSKYLMPSNRNEFTRCNSKKSMEFKGLGSQWIINWVLSWSVGSGEDVNCLRREERRSGQIAAPTKSEFSLLPNYVSMIMSSLKGIFKSVMDSQRALRAGCSCANQLCFEPEK